jgi:hypothetical protein
MNTLSKPILILATCLTFSCRNAADSKTKADDALREADQKISAASSDQASKSRAAQAEADLKIAEAEEAFTKLRDDYRSRTVLEIVALDADIAELEAKQKQATGEARVELAESLATIRDHRSRYTTARSALEGVGAGQWDAAKRDLDARWAELKALVARG